MPCPYFIELMQLTSCITYSEYYSAYHRCMSGKRVVGSITIAETRAAWNLRF